MTEDELYFNWLRDQSTPSDTISSYDEVLKLLYTTEYHPLHELDVNRAEEGVQLREQWADEYGIDISDEYLQEPCSVLEMFVALSRRCEFNSTHTSARHWVSIFLLNLDIQIADFEFSENRVFIEEVIDDFDCGVATIFPVGLYAAEPKELWVQMMEYIRENTLDV